MCLYYLFQNGKTHMVSDNTWIGAIVTKVYDGVRYVGQVTSYEVEIGWFKVWVFHHTIFMNALIVYYISLIILRLHRVFTFLFNYSFFIYLVIILCHYECFFVQVVYEDNSYEEVAEEDMPQMLAPHDLICSYYNRAATR